MTTSDEGTLQDAAGRHFARCPFALMVVPTNLSTVLKVVDALGLKLTAVPSDSDEAA